MHTVGVPMTPSPSAVYFKEGETYALANVPPADVYPGNQYRYLPLSAELDPTQWPAVTIE